MSDDALFKTITEIEEARTRATVAGDIDFVSGVVASNLCYVHGSGTQEDRNLYLERLSNGFYDYKELTSKRREFRRAGDTVMVHGDLHIHVIANGAEKDFDTRYLQVWIQEDGAWKMSAWQSTPLPAA